jgi:hypothetical protein
MLILNAEPMTVESSVSLKSANFIIHVIDANLVIAINHSMPYLSKSGLLKVQKFKTINI